MVFLLAQNFGGKFSRCLDFFPLNNQIQQKRGFMVFVLDTCIIVVDELKNVVNLISTFYYFLF